MTTALPTGTSAGANTPSDVRPLVDLVLRYPRAGRNIRRHAFQDVVRVGTLLASDLALIAAVRGALLTLRQVELGSLAQSAVAVVFPEGSLAPWMLTAAIVIALVSTGAYGAGPYRRDAARLLGAGLLASVIYFFQAFWTRPVTELLMPFVGVAAVFGSGLVVSRFVVDQIVQRVRSTFPRHRALLIVPEAGDRYRSEIRKLLARSEFVLADTVFLREDEELPELGRAIHTAHADTVLLGGEFSNAAMRSITDTSLAAGCRLLAMPRSPTLAAIEPKATWINGQAMVELTAPSLQARQLVVKRLLDLLGAGLGLTVLGPVLLVIAGAIKIDSRGPVFFKQERLGARGRRFRCIKFRSMHRDAEALLRRNGELYQEYLANHFKLPEELDPRLTRVGRFLRKTSLDELPQLFNVLLGHMSLVGPRPIVPDELDHYGGEAPLFLSLKPGITGAWAVSGRSHVGYPDRAQVELSYIRTWSLTSDLMILLQTVPAVLSGHGAH